MRKSYYVYILMFGFEWDETKAKRNAGKHGVSFDEAKEVFADDDGLEFFDEEHSTDEERWLRIGRTKSRRVLIVAYTWRKNDDSTNARIISARVANRKECKAYASED